MERETKEIRKGGHSYRVKTYATALEHNLIQNAYFKGAKVEVVGTVPKIAEFNPGIEFEVRQELIRQLVIEMDGSADEIVERCLQLPSDEFEELTAALDELISKKKT